MKSTVFKIKENQWRCEVNSEENAHEYRHVIYIEIPILEAYSIEYATVNFDNISTIVTTEDIHNNTIRIYSGMDTNNYDEVFVVINYQGIRDYSLLFPWIDDILFKARLGKFYEEMDITFENGAWLSYSLSVAAVIEGMLYAKLGCSINNLNKLLMAAKDTGIINEEEYSILDKARKNRNLVHSNKFEEEYVTKRECLDMRVVIDLLIKKFCETSAVPV